MAKGDMEWYDYAIVVLLIVGAVNWGLHALDYNIVDKLLGMGSVWSKIVYGLVATAGVVSIFRFPWNK